MKSTSCFFAIIWMLSTAACLAAPRGFFTKPIDVSPTPGRDSFGPTVTRDGLTMYFNNCSQCSVSPWGENDDIFTATRTDRSQPFGNVTQLESIVRPGQATEQVPYVAPDGRSLYFGSWDESLGENSNLYVATRTTEEDAFGNVRPLNVNDERVQNGPSLTADALQIFYHQREGDGDPDRDWRSIWFASRTDVDSPFGEPVQLPNSINDYHSDWPSISGDGLTLFFIDGDNGVTPRPGGRGENDIWVTTRKNRESEFTEPANLNDFWPGTNVNTSEWQVWPFISHDWPHPGSSLYFAEWTSKNGFIGKIMQSNWIAIGDVNEDLQWTVTDLDALSVAIQSNQDDSKFDIDGDGQVTPADYSHWVRELKDSWIGDANLDGEFNTSDLVAVFRNGHFEDSPENNSTWASGDWNADGDFSTADLVVAFQDGGFERGPRNAILAVPEPRCATTIALAFFAISMASLRQPTARKIRDAGSDSS